MRTIRRPFILSSYEQIKDVVEKIDLIPDGVLVRQVGTTALALLLLTPDHLVLTP